VVEPLHQRAGRDHRGQAGKLQRVAPLLCHTVEEAQQARQQWRARQFQRPLQHRQVGVQPPAGQQGAAGRAGHAHHAFDVHVAVDHRIQQRLQFGALAGIGLPGKSLPVLGPQFASAGHAGQHLGHQATARMGQQVQACALGQVLHQGQRVGDGAGAQRRVIQRVDAVAVVTEQRLDLLRVLRPQLAEGAAGLDEGAVHQHQHRLGRCGHAGQPQGGLCLQGCEQARFGHPVDAGVDL
jgi:hypothetical protein